MLRFAVLRILSAIPTLFIVIALAFMLIHAAPGGPFDAERVLPPEAAASIEKAYHLDEPLPQQFGRYLSGLLKGDLGPSYHHRSHTVSGIIAQNAPISFLLGSMSLILAIVVGFALGVSAALSRNTIMDRLISGISMSGISLPVFVIAPLMVLLFSVHLGWLPVSFCGGMDSLQGDCQSTTDPSRFILPVISLAIPMIAYIARLIRASMIEVLESDYVRTARAQGLKTSTIIFHHALKPASLPLLSYLGPAIAAVLTGSVVVEQIFGVPGLGQFFVNGALNRDYTLVLGLVIFYAILIIVLNLIVDLMYGFIDPRIRQR
jgi:oligopeptide transport system permease protein